MFGFGKNVPEPTDPLDAELKRIEEKKRLMREELAAIEQSLQQPSHQQPTRQDPTAFISSRVPVQKQEETLLGVEKKHFRNRAILLGVIVLILLIVVLKTIF